MASGKTRKCKTPLGTRVHHTHIGLRRHFFVTPKDTRSSSKFIARGLAYLRRHDDAKGTVAQILNDPRSEKDGNTPLGFAIANGHWRSALALVRLGARRCKLEADGARPIICSGLRALPCHSDPAEIEACAEVILHLGLFSACGDSNILIETPLHIAARKGVPFIPIIRALLERGAEGREWDLWHLKMAEMVWRPNEAYGTPFHRMTPYAIAGHYHKGQTGSEELLNLLRPQA